MDRPRAWVIGNLDLVRPLAAAGIECVAVAPPGAPVHRSRHVVASVPWPATMPDGQMAARLARLAAREHARPTLFYGSDRPLLLVSRHRDVLAGSFRFVIDDAEQVEVLVDKLRFRELATRRRLPVPPSTTFRPTRPGLVPDLPYPVLIKPATRDLGPWVELFDRRKGVLVEDANRLAGIWDRLVAARQEVVAQQYLPGPESRIESYHTYVPALDAPAVSFTGRKLRTWPTSFGNSTALETTDAPDIRAIGDAIVRELGIRGVAKLDFKRDVDGQPWLLEVNPRFSLWHHLGARAGVNIPAVVHADLTGARRPTVHAARPGVTWMHPDDARAAMRDDRVSLADWLRFAARCDCRSNLAWDDPGPALAGLFGRLVGADATSDHRSTAPAPASAPEPGPGALESEGR